jgi:hypothetical protein
MFIFEINLITYNNGCAINNNITEAQQQKKDEPMKI